MRLLLFDRQITYATTRAHRRAGVQVRVLADAKCAAKSSSLIKTLQDYDVPVKLTNGVEYTVRLVIDVAHSRIGAMGTPSLVHPLSVSMCFMLAALRFSSA